MIDVDAIKRSIDCRVVIGRDLGPPKHATGNYSLYKCPFHHERKGYSFVVYATHWRCFGKCGEGGDVIAWMMRYHDLGFQAACEQLAHGDLPRTNVRLRQTPRSEPDSEPPDEVWQKTAKRIAQQAADCLWQPQGQRALDYLRNKRGLTNEIIRTAQLGYIPGRPHEWIEVEGIKLPCGITIPWYADGAIWGIKVRRSAGEQRYQQASGGNVKGCLYLADHVQAGLPIFITEGEFDALIALQVGGKQRSPVPVSIGSASHRRINPRWFGKLLAAPRIWVCMDSDEAGVRAAAEIAQLSSAVQVVQVPIGKDMTEYYLGAGKQPVCEWLRQLSGQLD